MRVRFSSKLMVLIFHRNRMGTFCSYAERLVLVSVILLMNVVQLGERLFIISVASLILASATISLTCPLITGKGAVPSTRNFAAFRIELEIAVTDGGEENPLLYVAA